MIEIDFCLLNVFIISRDYCYFEIIIILFSINVTRYFYVADLLYIDKLPSCDSLKDISQNCNLIIIYLEIVIFVSKPLYIHIELVQVIAFWKHELNSYVAFDIPLC